MTCVHSPGVHCLAAGHSNGVQVCTCENPLCVPDPYWTQPMHTTHTLSTHHQHDLHMATMPIVREVQELKDAFKDFATKVEQFMQHAAQTCKRGVE